MRIITLKPWEDLLHEFAILPVPQYDLTNGKTIRFKVSKRANVRVELIDIRGKVVAKMSCGQLNTGVHNVLFHNVSSGHYICNIYQNSNMISADVIVR